MITMVSGSQLSGFTWRLGVFFLCWWHNTVTLKHLCTNRALVFCLFLFWVVVNLCTSVVFHQCVVVLNTLPFLWGNNITATAAGKVWRMAHRDVSEPGFSARHDHKQFLVFHHGICFIKSEWHLNSQTGDLATDNMHAGRSGCVDLTTFK